MIEIKEALDGRNYFNVKANNHEIVSTSQMYDFPSGAKAGAEALLKATGEYWKLALATLVEEQSQVTDGRLTPFDIADAIQLLLSLTNEDMQKIIDRIPYESK